MKIRIWIKENIGLTILLILLTVLIVCPLVMIFGRAVFEDGTFRPGQAWAVIADADNLETIMNSLLLGVCVVLCSTVIAAPTAWLLSRTQLASNGWLDIVFMIPFMTPPYIASMG